MSHFKADVETAVRMGSALPARMGVPGLLLATGWTYQELMATPDEVVQNTALLLSVRVKINNAKARR